MKTPRFNHGDKRHLRKQTSSEITTYSNVDIVGTDVLSRNEMIDLLNEDLTREYQAIIAYTVYSQMIDGAAYTAIAHELEIHAREELEHALLIAKQINYFGGIPTVTPKSVTTSKVAQEMLQLDLENERVTINQYRQRIRQAEAMGEYGLSETLRKIIQQEQEHEIDLASALGIAAPVH